MRLLNSFLSAACRKEQIQREFAGLTFGGSYQGCPESLSEIPHLIFRLLIFLMIHKHTIFLSPILIFSFFTGLAAQQVSGAQKAALPKIYIDTDLSATPVTGSSIKVNAGGDLQAAIDSANPGDEIVLQAGATFVGNFVLPQKAGTGWITIRSSNMSALPAEGVRVSPSDAANMPTIVAEGVSTAFWINPQASHYRLMGLEVTAQPKQWLNYGLIMEGNPYDTNVDDLPNNIIFDRDYVHGQVLCHCKSGIQTNGAYFSVINSYVSEFHGLGQDTQAITSYMSPGPQKIVNNYIEGSGENVLWGGAYDAIPGIHPYDVEFRTNHVAKKMSWRNSIVPPPQALAASAQAGGSLPAGTYYYSIIALGTVGTLNTLPGQAQSTLSSEVSVPVTNGQNAVQLSWQETAYGDSTDTRLADNYIILRTTDSPSASTRNWVYYGYTPGGTGTSLSFTDTGAAAAAWNSSWYWPRVWDVKNLLEIKNGIRFLIDGNVFENNWENAQDGHAILFTARTEVDGSYPVMIQNTDQDITFTNNIVRHTAAAVNILSADYLANPALYPELIPSARMYIAGNLFDDINGYTYNGLGSWLDFGGQPNNVQGLSDLIVDHNTALHTGNIGSTAFSNLTPSFGPFVFTNNITANNWYGFHISSASSDWGTLERLFSSLDWTNNVITLMPGTSYGSYTNAPGDFFPSTEAAVGFVNYNNGDGGNYQLSSSSPYKDKATDGTDPGANITALNALVQLALTGQPSSSSPSTPAAPTAAAPGMYDDRSTWVIYKGSWSQASSWLSFDQTQSLSSNAGDTASLTFNGTQVSYIYEGQPNAGQVQVSIDGNVVTPNLDEFSAWGQQQEQATYSGLTPGVHTITITVLGTKDSQSSNSYAIIDAFSVGQ